MEMKLQSQTSYYDIGENLWANITYFSFTNSYEYAAGTRSREESAKDDKFELVLHSFNANFKTKEEAIEALKERMKEVGYEIV